MTLDRTPLNPTNDRAGDERITIAAAHVRELRAAAQLQKRAFRPPLAYRYGTLLLLWLLPQVRFWIAKDGDTIIGCAIGDLSRGQSRVVNICVDPAYQRRGLGRRLLRQLETSLPTGNMILMVEADNERAQALYRSEGYATTGRSINYYGKGKDGIWMKRIRGSGGPPKLYC